MMQKLRSFSKGFLIFVVIAFVGSIIFAWGMDLGSSSNVERYIAKINGEKIDPKLYDNILQNLSNQYTQNGYIYLDWPKIVEIRNNAWDQMVYDIVMSQQIKKLGIEVSDAELFQYLWNYPPQFMWQEPSLQTDGRFDLEKYHQLLADPGFASNLAFIEQQQLPQIQRLQWSELMRASVQITPEELMWEFRKENEKIKLEYVYIPIAKVSEPEVFLDSADIVAFYEEHKDKYQRDDKAELEFVAFDVFPSSTDSSNTSDMDIWLQQITESEQDVFSLFAATISDDTRARNNGGEIGWVAPGRYSPEFDSIAFLLDSGQISSQPIQTSAGWHIIKSLGKRTNDAGVEEAHLFQILKKIRPSGDTFSEKFTQAKQFLDEVDVIGFDQTAEKYGLSVSLTGPFGEGAVAGRLGNSEEAVTFAFSAENGDVSDVLMIADTRRNSYKFVVVRLKDKITGGTLDADEAYTFAQNDLRKARLLERAYGLAEDFHTKLVDSRDFVNVAKDLDLKLESSEFFGRSETRAVNLASDPNFMGAAFGLTMQNPVSKPLYTKNGVVVMILTGKTFNPAEFDIKKDAIFNRIWAQKINSISRTMSSDLVENAEIEDYRSTNFKWFF